VDPFHAQPNMKTKSFQITIALALMTLAPRLSTVFAQGSLTPPGAPAPMMKSLDQIEPRTPISSVPFTISAAGSYYLTTNLTAAAGNNGIIVTADHVTIDLNGFMLTGVAGFASSNAIHLAGTRFNVSVRGGTIHMWKQGIAASSGSELEFADLRVSSCSSNGITAGFNAMITHCSANSAGGYGIYGGVGSTIRDCVTQSCAGTGIYGGNGSTIANCAVNGSGAAGYGIATASGCVVKDCSASFNNTGGINVGDGSRISGCTVYNNFGPGVLATHSTIENCSVNFNSSEGIQVVSYCTVMNNNCYNNGGFTGNNIHATGSYNRIEENHCLFANRGFKVDSTGNVVVRNSAGGNNTNYVIAAANLVGGFISSSSVTATNSNPHANYDF